MPPIKRGGLIISENKVWAPSTGRTLDGTFIGTLVGIKLKLQCTFIVLDQQDLRVVLDAVNKDFMSVEFLYPHEFARIDINPDPKSWFTQKRMYAGDVSYKVEQMDISDKGSLKSVKYSEVTVDLIEQ